MSEETREALERWIERVWVAGRRYQQMGAKNGRTVEETEEMQRLAQIPDDAKDALRDRQQGGEYNRDREDVAYGIQMALTWLRYMPDPSDLERAAEQLRRPEVQKAIEKADENSRLRDTLDWEPTDE